MLNAIERAYNYYYKIWKLDKDLNEKKKKLNHLKSNGPDVPKEEIIPEPKKEYNKNSLLKILITFIPCIIIAILGSIIGSKFDENSFKVIIGVFFYMLAGVSMGIIILIIIPRIYSFFKSYFAYKKEILLYAKKKVESKEKWLKQVEEAKISCEKEIKSLTKSTSILENRLKSMDVPYKMTKEDKICLISIEELHNNIEYFYSLVKEWYVPHVPKNDTFDYFLEESADEEREYMEGYQYLYSKELLILHLLYKIVEYTNDNFNWSGSDSYIHNLNDITYSVFESIINTNMNGGGSEFYFIPSALIHNCYWDNGGNICSFLPTKAQVKELQ